YGPQRVTPAEFRDFSEPGHAKLAISFAVRPSKTGTVLRYEARTATTNFEAWQAFHHYWRLIHWGVALVMRRALQRIKVHAEAGAGRHINTRVLPGDFFISKPIGSLTHAITMRCEPRDVWPWLAQMGAGRAGWYSYDRIDNGGRPSATDVLPQFQKAAPGTLFPALPGATGGFFVADSEAEHFLVLAWPAPDGTYMTTWAFVLDKAGPGRTRLIVRSRASSAYHLFGLPSWVIKRLVPFGHFIMQRKQLLGIARRAEQCARASRAGSAAPPHPATAAS